MSNCRPKKEIVEKEISHWYAVEPATFPPTYARIPEGTKDSDGADFDFKHWHEVGGQNNNLKLVRNGSKLEKLQRVRLYVPRGEDSDGNTEYKWEYVYQQKYEVKLMDSKDAKDLQRDELQDPENEYNILGYDTEGFYEGGDPIYYNKPIFKRQCKANTVYDEQYFSHVFSWDPNPIVVNRKIAGLKLTTKTPPATGEPPTSTPVKIYEAVESTATGNLTIQRVDSEIANPPEGMIYYHGGTADNKIFFTYTPDSNSDGTLKVMPIGDTVNGWTVSKVVNYVTDKSLRRNVSKKSAKNKTPSYVFVNDMINPQGKVNSVSNLPSPYTGSIDDIYIVDVDPETENQEYYQWNGTIWIGPVNVTGIQVGDRVKGKGIRTGTVVTEIKGRKIFLSKPLTSRKVRRVTFINDVVNKVNSSTICYAEITGGSDDFTKDTEYVTGAGCKINVVAGKGIKSRSAIVGFWVASDRKYLEYAPYLYTRDSDCEKTFTEDDNAKYTLGDIVFSDGSFYKQQQELVTYPKNNFVYEINKIYWTAFGIPVDKTSLLTWMSKYNESQILDMKLDIIQTIQTQFGNKVISKVLDSVCNDEIQPEMDKIYYPYEEIKDLEDKLDPIQDMSTDPCIVDVPLAAFSSEELSNYISNNLENVIASSGMILPDEMYKRVIGNEDSMMNILKNASKKIEDSISRIQEMPKLPPMMEAENESPIPLTIDTIRRLPPKFGVLEYLIQDLVFTSDDSLNPNSIENNPVMTIRSIPRFTGTVTAGNADFTINTTYTNVGGTNYVNEVLLTNAPPTTAGSESSLPGYIPPLLPPTYTSTTIEWLEPGGPLDDHKKDVNNKQFIDHKTCSGARPYPCTIWKPGTNYQYQYGKTCNFRVNEISSAISEALKNKGNPYQDAPVYAEFTSDVLPSDTTISVKSTTGFMSSGYLLIPKYIIKQEKSDLNNVQKHFFYLGEEIIYYKNKTSTSFQNCTRGMFGTNSAFEVTLNASEILSGYLYTIKTLGDTDWKSFGAPEGFAVGTTFKSTQDGPTTTTGEVYVFGSTMTPFENAPQVNTVFTSYEKRNYVAQFWAYQVNDKEVTV
jgi:hypothetical protein